MANEIQIQHASGKTLYAVLRNDQGQAYNTSSESFEAYATANYADYVVALTEQGTASGYYSATIPSTLTSLAQLSVDVRSQVGGSPAETDGFVGGGNIEWDGSAVRKLSDTSTSGQVGRALPMRIARGTMIENFLFKLVSSTDNVSALTSGVVSGQISRDGGSFGAIRS